LKLTSTAIFYFLITRLFIFTHMYCLISAHSKAIYTNRYVSDPYVPRSHIYYVQTVYSNR